MKSQSKLFQRIALFAASTLFSVGAFAAEITPSTLVGKYKIEASVFFQKIYGNFNVVNTREFDFQRTYNDGTGDEICSGTFTISAGFVPFFNEVGQIMASGKLFKGFATCPSDRSKTMEFDVEFSSKTTTQDLVKGTTVRVRTSMAGGVTVNASVKKQ